MSALKAFCLFACIALLNLSATGASWGQDNFPSKPVRLIVAIGPGASNDALARFLAAGPLRQQLGTEVIVENKPGAGGVLGGEFLAKSKPDGYTLGLLHASVMSTVTVINPNVTYDPVRDFTPIATLVTNQLALVVSASSKWTSLAQLIDDSKSGNVHCGLIGLGSQTHFNVELLKLATGAKLNLVPFSAGTGAILTALMGNHISCTSLTWAGVSSHVKAGKLRALAVTSMIKDQPQIPTFASEGLPQVSLEVFNAAFGPAGLPKEVQVRLEQAFRRVMADPKTTAELERQGFSILYEDSLTLAARVKRDLSVVREVFQKAGLKQES